jgi:hypothetical protein
LDKLPAPQETSNPIVNKGMHELRRVVNAVIKQYGKPSERLEWLGSNSIKHNLIAVCLSKSQ